MCHSEAEEIILEALQENVNQELQPPPRPDAIDECEDLDCEEAQLEECELIDVDSDPEEKLEPWDAHLCLLYFGSRSPHDMTEWKMLLYI